MKFFCFLIFLLLFGFIPAVGSAEQLLQGDLQMQKFSSYGADAKGNYTWVLEGEEAQRKGSILTLTNPVLVLQKQGEPAQKVHSTECQYLDTLRELKSTAPIFLEANEFSATGIGYDIYIEEKIIHIRSAVRIRIYRRKAGKK